MANGDPMSWDDYFNVTRQTLEELELEVAERPRCTRCIHWLKPACPKKKTDMSVYTGGLNGIKFKCVKFKITEEAFENIIMKKLQVNL